MNMSSGQACNWLWPPHRTTVRIVIVSNTIAGIFNLLWISQIVSKIAAIVEREFLAH